MRPRGLLAVYDGARHGVGYLLEEALLLRLEVTVCFSVGQNRPRRDALALEGGA